MMKSAKTTVKELVLLQYVRNPARMK